MHIEKSGVEKSRVEKSGSGNFMVDMSEVEKFIIAMFVKKFLLAVWFKSPGLESSC